MSDPEVVAINPFEKDNQPLLKAQRQKFKTNSKYHTTPSYGVVGINSPDVDNEHERMLRDPTNKKNQSAIVRGFHWMDNYFEISKRGSSFGTEIRGGTVGFLTLAYIVLLNPQVLAISGIPYQYAASSTCLASGIATLICGIWGNIPVGCGPGVGLSAYFSYGMVPAIMGSHPSRHPYYDGLFMAFLSGAVVFVLTIPGIVTYIVSLLPQFIKVATIVGMGLFLAFVGMVDVGLVVHGKGDAILDLGDMGSWVIWLALMNCLLISSLKYFKINGSLLLCIIVTSIIYFAVSGEWPTEFISFPKFMNPYLVLDPNMIKHLPIQTALESIISFVLIIFLDVSGVTFAIARLCGLCEERRTLMAFQKSAYIGTSIGTMIAALLGCSPIIVCIETSSGAAAGARTGLSAVVMALYFFVSMFLGPVIGAVPAAATSPVLIFIGTLMMGQVGQIAWDNMRIAIPAFFCIAMMPFTYSISNGLFFGVLAFFMTWLSTGQFLTKWHWFGFEKPFDRKFGYSNASNTPMPELSRSAIYNKGEPSFQRLPESVAVSPRQRRNNDDPVQFH
eukprot:CAMPEP_0197023872 /NCGR_PEP_ID=MMETSP1384-20130603/4510_1 /TAXON_ID=29189 /ORGANISM="Ammonia sp." /LENGTH=559 /DNA_ID=CAMNT_0042452161 /DNA_START=75 /DNA_END=1754 /DNA_ORIENTATION=-